VAIDGICQKEQFPYLKFIDKERYSFFHSKPDELKLILSEGFVTKKTFKIDPCDYIALSPNENTVLQIAFITKHDESTERKRFGRITLVSFPEMDKPILDKTFTRAHEIKLLWSANCRRF
jgi:hypothetical protein